MATNNSRPSLREITQHRFEDVLRTAAETCPGWTVMVLDKRATRVISSVIGMYDLMESARVTIVEQLERKRKPFPEMEVIYIISPTQESMDHVLQDFQPNNVSYGDVHIFTLSTINNSLISQIRSNTLLLERIKTLSEINIDFLTPEPYSFNFDMNSSFKEFLTDDNIHSDDLEVIADRLVTLCASINEWPYVRYNKNNTKMEQLANLFINKLKNFINNNTTWTWVGNNGPNDTHKQRATLLLFDRSDDILTPFIHDLYYEPMCYDLLPIHEGRIDIGNKTVLLNDSDDLWSEFRYTHIAYVLETLGERFKDFLSTSKGTQLVNTSKEDTNTLTLSEMNDAVRAIPEYKQTIEKFSRHTTISSECMNKFNQKNLNDVVMLEQNLICGTDEEGNKINIDEIYQQLLQLIQTNINDDIKIRLICIYLITTLPNEENMNNLLRASSLTNIQRSVILNVMNCIERLGVNNNNNKKKNKNVSGANVLEKLIGSSNIKAETKKSSAIHKGRSMFSSLLKKSTSSSSNNSKTDDEEEGYTLSRWIPTISKVLSHTIDHTLSEDDFPYIDERPAVFNEEKQVKSVRRKHKLSAPNSSNKSHSHDTHGGRIITFFAGGVTHSEIRSAYTCMNQTSREIFIGGTSFITPLTYIQNFGSLNQNDIMSLDQLSIHIDTSLEEKN